MLDSRIQPLINVPLDWVGRAIAKLGVSANAITLVGTAAAVATTVALAYAEYGVALLSLAVCRTCDGLDGAVARASARSDLGGYLDIVSDYVFYGGVPLGFACASPATNALPAAGLLASFLLTASSFLGFAALADKRGAQMPADRQKSFFYSHGLIEGTETIAFFVVMTLWPAHFATLAWVLAGLCVITAFQRSATAVREFRK